MVLLQTKRNRKPKSWFFNQAIGVSALAPIIPNIVKEAGWDSAKLWSGHSLKASAITALYDHGFDDNSVKKIISLRSDFAVQMLRISEKRSEERIKQTNEILSETS